MGCDFRCTTCSVSEACALRQFLLSFMGEMRQSRAALAGVGNAGQSQSVSWDTHRDCGHVDLRSCGLLDRRRFPLESTFFRSRGSSSGYRHIPKSERRSILSIRRAVAAGSGTLQPGTMAWPNVIFVTPSKKRPAMPRPGSGWQQAMTRSDGLIWPIGPMREPSG